MLVRANIERTKGGAIVQRTQCPTYEHFIGLVNSNAAFERVYDDGLTACYVNRKTRDLFAFCEGDVTIYDCPTRKELSQQVYDHYQYFINS